MGITQRKATKNSEKLSHSTVDYLLKNFLETGSLNKRSPPGRKENDENVNVIAEIGEVKSVRSASQLTKLSKSTVHRILTHKLNMFPYKKQYEHFVSANAQQERHAFCEKFLAQVDADPDFLDRILFTDESIFDCNAHLNKQNDRIWAPKGSFPPPNPSFPAKQYPQKIMVWAGFSSRVCIGPFFFNSTVTAESYQQMLKDYVIPNLKKHKKFSTTIFQQDGAKPPNALNTKEFLKLEFG